MACREGTLNTGNFAWRVEMKRTQALIAAMIVTLCTVCGPSIAAATADPPQGVNSNRLIANGPGMDSTACEVVCKHGNVFAVGYAEGSRGSSGSLWPTSSSSYASSGYRYGWGLSYNNVPDGQPLRCTNMAVYVTVLYSGNLYEYSASGSGSSVIHVQGPTYSSLVGSYGFVAGATYPGGGQPIASRSFPGF